MSDIFNIENNIAKLKWAASRRGMVELDILLGNYLNEAYINLSTNDKTSFIQLLSCPDPDLFQWLIGGSQPEDNALAKIVVAIREHARNRVSN